MKMEKRTEMTREIRQEFLTGERALFGERDLAVYDTIFADGESPLKESRNVALYGSMFKWKYPFWYAKHISMKDCTLFEMARAGIWYTEDVIMEDTIVEAPKNFRRCKGVVMKNVYLPNAAETLWQCDGVEMENVTAKGDYFAMNSSNMKLNGFCLLGNYSFDGVKNVEIRNAKMLSKDAFWNSENVTVYDSYISGEYLGWNAKNLTLIRCTIESLQGMCYIDNLVMKNCKLINTTLAFEYSTVEADITGTIDSVMNPSGGTICADHIRELILEKDKIDGTKTKIICRKEERPAGNAEGNEKDNAEDNAKDNTEGNEKDNAEGNVRDNAEDNAKDNAEGDAKDNTEGNVKDNAKDGAERSEALKKVI